MKLYDLERSGNCYKVRLLLSLLGFDYERRTVDLAKREQHEPWFLALNPRHTVPVLDDAGTIVRDSGAILVYLAAAYGRDHGWYSDEPREMAAIQEWLCYANNEILHHLAFTRGIKLGLRPGDLAKGQEAARGVLAQMEASLAGSHWLAAGRATIADVACYPYVAMIPQADVPLDAYPAVRAWCARIEALPGYTPLPRPPGK